MFINKVRKNKRQVTRKIDLMYVSFKKNSLSIIDRGNMLTYITDLQYVTAFS